MEEQLWKACSEGKVEEVRKLLQDSQINTNWQSSDSSTPFYIACQQGHIEIVKLLLNDQRVDINKAVASQHKADSDVLYGQSEGELAEIERQAEIVLDGAQSLINAIGDSAAIVANVKPLALDTIQLANTLRQQARNFSDQNEKNRLLIEAIDLAGSITKIVNVAKDAVRNPEDPGAQSTMKAAVEALQNAAKSALRSDDTNKAIKKLIIVAKAHAAAIIQLISASKACSPSIKNQVSQLQLIHANKGAFDNCGQLVTAVKNLLEKPDDSFAQWKLVNVSKAALIPGQTLIASSKSASPTIGDLFAQGQLFNFSKAAAESLKNLKEAVESVEVVSNGLELLNDERVDINKATNGSFTPFYAACQKGHIEIVKFLLKDQRVDINKASNDDTTPFYIACQNGHIEIVKYLLESGREIDINKKWKNTKTPLDISKQRSTSTQKFNNETEEEFQKARKNCPKIVELIESFQRNPIETRAKLRSI